MEWVLLKLYMWRDVMLMIFIPLLIVSIGAVIYVTWKATQEQVVGK